jgi:glycosyltransferase involved in cell wall biosynthesis
MGGFRSRRIALVESLTSRVLAASVVCVCNAVAESTRARERVPRAKLRVVLNGIEARLGPDPPPNGSGSLAFGMVATIDRKEKGAAEFIEAAAIVDAALPGRARFHIVGDGSLRSELEAGARARGLARVITFHGQTSDVGRILGEIDVLAVPSYTEGISNALLEAMARGRPAVATAVDGNLEVVVDGVTGLLVPSRDPRALAEAFLRYLGDPAMAAAHGANARERARTRFSLEAMRRAYLDLYADCLSDRRCRMRTEARDVGDVPDNLPDMGSVDQSCA